MCCISKIQKNESNSQLSPSYPNKWFCCVVSQRYRKMKAIHNNEGVDCYGTAVVLYLKDTEKWKQFTTIGDLGKMPVTLCCISKIQKNESNSQPDILTKILTYCCVVSQRYRKMKAIHNSGSVVQKQSRVVLYLKDTEKWKQFTTINSLSEEKRRLCCISKIQKNKSNSQHYIRDMSILGGCVVSQRYRKMKAIHNFAGLQYFLFVVVLYLKDIEKWKQFTTTVQS